MEVATMRIFALASLLLLVSTAFADAGVQQSDARAEINNVLDEYIAALLEADVPMLAKIWTDDYTFINGRGMLLSKDDRLKNFKTGATELKSIKETGREVQFYGDDTAILTGQVTLEAKYSGQSGSGEYRYTNVLIKQGNSWKLAATQITPMVE
jgi:uncharacterized protein (TIGR02246 family)